MLDLIRADDDSFSKLGDIVLQVGPGCDAYLRSRSQGIELGVFGLSGECSHLKRDGVIDLFFV